jgi:competence protein ComEA
MPSESPQRTVLYVGLAVLAIVIGWRYHATSSSAPAEQYAAAGRAPAVQAPAPPPVVVVDVAGAVRRPGVYRLPSGARVQDAVRRARVTRAADLSGVNLAARLADGEQIVVPRRGADGVSATATGGSTDSPVVSINSGTLEQLETLDGIGPSLAQRIIDYRTAHGGFRGLDELDNVSGIGPARLAALRGHVSL